MAPILVIFPNASDGADPNPVPPPPQLTTCQTCGSVIPLTPDSVSRFGKSWNHWYQDGAGCPRLQELKDSSSRCAVCLTLCDGLVACVPHITPSTKIGRSLEPSFNAGLILETKDPQAKVQFFALPGTRSPCENMLPGNMVSGNTSSESALRTMTQWVETCERSHRCCQSFAARPSFFPTRIVSIGTNPGDDIRLHEPSFLERLEVHSRYITLSHCWGESQPVTTSLATINDRKRKIPWEILPRTFQDAIATTRRLGVQYLWIDSLCIIQDDKDDWRKEAGLMCDVYQNAWLNLAATKSSNCHGGLFSAILQTTISTQSGRFRFQAGARQVIEHSKLLPGKTSAAFPLLDRGWVYQERLLARRIIHFGPQEMSWECSEALTCECTAISEPTNAYGEEYVPPKIQHGRALALPDHREARSSVVLSRRWRRIVVEYSNLQLSHASDIFPALAGLAKQFRQHRDDEYLAGLWRSTIVQDLAWRVHKSTNSSRPTWRAPSWSWASILDPIEYIRQVEGHRRAKGEDEPENMAIASVREVRCVPAGRFAEDSTGELRDAYLKLSSWVVPAYLGICYKRNKPHYEPSSDYDTYRTQEECDFLNAEIAKEPDYEYLDGDEASAFLESGRELWKMKYYVRVDGEVEMLANLDTRLFDNNDWVLRESKNILCLKLTKVLFGDGTVNYDSLLLRRRGHQGKYERVGLVRSGDDWYASGAAVVETVTIV